jgi:hypothetical protein
MNDAAKTFRDYSDSRCDRVTEFYRLNHERQTLAFVRQR